MALLDAVVAIQTVTAYLSMEIKLVHVKAKVDWRLDCQVELKDWPRGRCHACLSLGPRFHLRHLKQANFQSRALAWIGLESQPMRSFPSCFGWKCLSFATDVVGRILACLDWGAYVAYERLYCEFCPSSACKAFVHTSDRTSSSCVQRILRKFGYEHALYNSLSSL